jgi:hypothetical protein
MIGARQCLFIGCGVALLMGVSTTAQSSDPFSLSLSAPSTVKAGSDVYVQVAMRNLSDGPVDCSRAYSNALDLRYRFLVRGESGNQIKRRVSKHPELGGAGSITTCTLDPGESTPAEDNLISNMYNLKSPGKYTVQALRGVEGPSERYIGSNVVTIVVAP